MRSMKNPNTSDSTLGEKPLSSRFFRWSGIVLFYFTIFSLVLVIIGELLPYIPDNWVVIIAITTVIIVFAVWLLGKQSKLPYLSSKSSETDIVPSIEQRMWRFGAALSLSVVIVWIFLAPVEGACRAGLLGNPCEAAKIVRFFLMVYALAFFLSVMAFANVRLIRWLVVPSLAILLFTGIQKNAREIRTLCSSLEHLQKEPHRSDYLYFYDTKYYPDYTKYCALKRNPAK